MVALREDEPRETEVKRPGAKMKGASSWLTTFPLKTSTSTRGHSTMRSAVGTTGYQSNSHLLVLAGRDSTLIMQCIERLICP